MISSRTLLLGVLLSGCAPTTPAPGTAPASSAPAAPAPHAAKPYEGEPGTCSLDGLSVPLYSQRDARWGKPTAPVAIILFSDFECPYCARQRHALDDVKTRYGAEKIQIIWKQTPLEKHPNARPAAEVSQAVFEAAGADAFWRFHDLTFANRKNLSPEGLVGWAAEVGVPPERLKPALEKPSTLAKLKEDLALGRAIGLQATPTLLLNGHPLEGAQSTATLVALIDEELAAARPDDPHAACNRMRASWAPGE